MLTVPMVGGMTAQFIFTMRDLRRFHPPDREGLKGINISMFPGAKIGVIGANGSGMSSLLRIMAGGGHGVPRAAPRAPPFPPAAPPPETPPHPHKNPPRTP